MKSMGRRCALYGSIIRGQYPDGSSVPKLILENQIDRLKKYCAEKGWTATSVYRDILSVKKQIRPQLELMVDEISKGKFNTVIILAPKCLAQTKKELKRLIAIFDQANIEFISLKPLEEFPEISLRGKADRQSAMLRKLATSSKSEKGD